MSLHRPLWLPLVLGSFVVVGLCIRFIDRPVVALLHAQAPPAAIDLAILLGVLADPTPYFVGTALTYLLARLRRQSSLLVNRALFLLLAIGMGASGAFLLQVIAGRPRPYLYLEQQASGLHPFIGDASFMSFPSQHATVAGAMVAALSVLLPDLWPTFALLAVLVASSRVVLNMHYPSDAVAGLLLGGGIVVGLVAVFRRWGIVLRNGDVPSATGNM
jgi:membrane-associated phospholipid phosphatase